MSLKDKLVGRASGIAEAVAKSSAESAAVREPVTMPGRLGAFRLEAQKFKDEIDELKRQLASAQATRLEIPLNELHEAPGRKRRLSAGEYAELKANLQKNPLIHPIIVRPRAEGGFEIVAGHNRVQIYRELGRETIEANIREYEDEHAYRAAFYSNLLSPSLPDYEKYLGFKAIMEVTGYTQEQLAQDAGVSETTVSRLFKFRELPPAALDAIARNPQCVGGSAVEKMAAAINAGKSDRVIEAVRRLAEDEKFTQTQALAFINAAPKVRTSRPEPVVFRSGRKKFCELNIRGGTIGLHFSDASAAEAWKDKLEAFIRNELKESEEGSNLEPL